MSMAKHNTMWAPLPILAAVCMAAIIRAICPSGPLASAQDQARQDAQGGLRSKIATPSGVEMVLIPGGEFLMGKEADIDARPVHKVSVSSFYMDIHETTQELYEKITGENPARRTGKQNPVERVRWTDAIKFCNARSAKEGLQPCYDVKTGECDFSADGYRLPTEAEWEYACRAGTTGNYYFGNDPARLKDHAWFKVNALGRHHPVGQKRPNPYGLFDMAGNVREWCNDWYQVDYYKNSPAVAPRGPAQGAKKVLRGGAWTTQAESCSSWTRYCDDPGFTDACVPSDDYGFRCVRSPRPIEKKP